MRTLSSLTQAPTARRLASLLGALAMLSLMSGCVVYAEPLHIHPAWHYWR